MLDPGLPLDQLKSAYENWRRTKGGNLNEVLNLFDDRIEMHSVLEPGVKHELARVQTSREDTKAYFRELLDNWEMIYFPTEKVLADGDTVVWIGRCHWRNRKDGNVLDTPKIDVWTFRNGKAVRFFEMFDSLGFARAAGLL
ncbi:nuclear transport factor 2 family protein [Sphingomonas sediminicola]|uniref:Nuclear transport factor 2 family protein n=1 Tax=Sphingomonas sediminicola TaxID=386874 RepID=A0ABX6T6K4_9SPHN|nr:nuclear transport factor 2 family protein [Sphingomonas sediminicola]QNP45415.1 nuclear transport factor 2 family protein [Sphingomonas sediminicola]